MASSKSLYIAIESLRRFFWHHPTAYYWTWTFAEKLEDKEEAERRFKPLKDLIKRRGGEFLDFWELQERGAWHVHVITNIYLDVNWLRPWLVARGWGPIMKVKRVESRRTWSPGVGWVRDDRDEAHLIGYLCKYLTKCFREASAFKKKVFGGNRRARVGTTLFKWVPWEKPGAYLYYWGVSFFLELEGRMPRFRDISRCIRLGYEVSGWCDVDPWYLETSYG